MPSIAAFRGLHCWLGRAGLAGLLAATLLATGCTTTHTVQNPVTGRTERSVLTEAQLQAQADEAREALIDEHGLYVHPAVQGYVSEIGLKVAQLSHSPELAWSFTILDTEISNAFALPRGQVFVTRGLLALLQSEAELAAVLGHEIAHVTARHGAHRATEAAFANIGVAAAINVGQFLERSGLRGAAQRMKKLGLSLAAGLIATYDREQELEADRIGADYLARAGYDAREMVGVLEVLQMVERFHADRARESKREAPGSDWLSSHPGTDQRLREARRFTAAARRVAGDGRERFLQRIDGLVWGDSPEKGLVRERLFVHPRAGYAVTAPTGWELDVEGSAVALQAPEGDATLTVRLLPKLAGRTHAQVIENLLAPTEGRSSPRKVGSFNGTHFIGSRLRGDVRQPLRATVVSGPGQRLYLIDYTARDEAALQRSLAAMQGAEQSFRAINAADRRAAQVWRIGTTPLPAGGFAALAKASPLRDDAEPTLRLINGLYGVTAPDAEPAAGTPVKTVR
jgi:predicted Zn-dependent protease